MFAVSRFVHLVYKTRLRNELGINAFDYTKSTKRLTYEKNTLEVVIYLIGIAGGLLITAGEILTPILNNSLILYSGVILILFAGVLFGYLKLSKKN